MQRGISILGLALLAASAVPFAMVTFIWLLFVVTAVLSPSSWELRLWWSVAQSLGHMAAFWFGAFQVGAALRAVSRRRRVACAAESAVDVCACFSCLHKFFIRYDLILRRAFKFHVFRLWRAAAFAGFDRAGVADIAVRAGPFQLDESLAFLSCHKSLLFIHFL